MGHPNSKKHKIEHAGYRAKPTQKAIKANFDLWSGFKSNKPAPVEIVDLELDALFGKELKELKKIGTQLKLF